MKKISPSLMCVNIFELEEKLEIFEEEKIDYLHMDIMDGNFVPNITLGVDYLNQVRKKTTIPFDIHLMVDRPEDKLDWFDFRKGDMVSVHVESSDDILGTIMALKKKEVKVLLAVKPATPIEDYYNFMDMVDGFLLMTVEPGFAGQALKAESLKKIEVLSTYLATEKKSKIIEVDGNVSYENAKKMSDLGANVFVAGTSSFLAAKEDTREGIRLFRNMIG